MAIVEAVRQGFWGEGFRLASKSKRTIEALGGTCRIIDKGNESNPLARALDHTMLGPHLAEGVVLTPLELEVKAHHKPVNCIIDLDGVIVHPWQWLLDEVEGDKHDSLIPSFRALVQITERAAHTTIWTSRFNIEKNPYLSWLGRFVEGRIPSFPFMNKTGIMNLERLGKGKVEVRTNKSLRNPVKDLVDIIDDYPADLYYYVGSSGRDREAVAKYLVMKETPAEKQQLIFLDTGHWKL
ncbi:hypothetical protein HY468_03940 [Candidatus Roizmanbacteria bacterium]|nr:hypothetical protein [Candidatus Roizmanbacteria bacterium]